jgi:succinate-acetate transporter protein
VSPSILESRLDLNGHTVAGSGHGAPAPTPVANAGPLGLSAFAITTFLLSMVNAGLIAKGAEPIVFGVALMVGGLAQVLAGMWEFRAGNTFAGTAFVAYGTFWLSFWALVQFYVADIPKADVGAAVGLYLIAWGIFTAYMFVASFKTTRELMSCYLGTPVASRAFRPRVPPGPRHRAAATIRVHSRAGRQHEARYERPLRTGETLMATGRLVDLQVKQCRSLGSGFILVRSGANLCGRLS